ncbi:acyl-CoA synthetase, long-chain fatty acid:CoA ligase [Streptomyces sp. e14]|uniref:AMP-binding protein n=1 Tax=Streptomyces sp. e14 TaxID=645465 RepID=UPI0001D063EC|nr:AMP-binding protein [Streptomyces sp. e14]EFF88886.1 acyl-CoA synthetase, long-chain fatty acid:CoA ligase [Streptomyces sp. e14]
MSNLVTALVEAAERHPLRLAVQEGDSALTYAELDEFSARAAGGLLAHGVRPGDRVGLRLPYVPAFAVLYFGALRAGAVVVPYPRTWPLAVVRPRGDAGGARLAFSTPAAPTGRERGTGDTTLVPVGPDFLQQMAFWPQFAGVADRAGHDPAVVVRTGATGDAEDAVLSHGALREAARTTRMLINEATADDIQGSAPVLSAIGRTYGPHAVVVTGACLPVEEGRTAPSSHAPAEREDGTAKPRTVRANRPARFP